ncbi:MAG: aminoglycoside phosphotransferase family protein [Lachnospiraceae bacterium]|nr:aminoglycoside phosphotransferase family protein [Lachnospiraceae bacterium]
MIGQKIGNMFLELGLGNVERPVEPVSGGFLHRMYKVYAGGKAYAVKHLNPLIMKRPDAISNYDEAEKLESIIEGAGIPIVPALRLTGRKRQYYEGDFFYIFDWHDGRMTDWYHITGEQCFIAGNILGRMHALAPKTGEKDETEESRIDFGQYIRNAEASDPDLWSLLSENEELLPYAERELNKARKRLPDIVCISDEDMDPKNVMWENGQPAVIDLECLKYGNPVSHVLQLSLQWSGITICRLDPGLVKAFFNGYLKAYDNDFRDYPKVFGLAYTWLEWLEYNLGRALSDAVDEKEREMGKSEARNTVNRIRCLYENEAEIRRVLGSL